MEINRDAPAIGSGDIKISAPPAVVWDILVDIDAWPGWNPDVKTAHLRGPLAVGTSFRWKSGIASLKSELRSVEPSSEIGWTGTTMSIKAVHVFRLHPEDGGTHVRSEESWEGTLARMMKGYSRKSIGTAIDTALTALKREAEARAA
jgi:uncharacterized protein YndB with AHSA1/START domain